MSKFLGYTVGLQAVRHGEFKLVKIEYRQIHRVGSDAVQLTPVSGLNLSRVPGVIRTITMQEYHDRPDDNIDEAIEMLSLCGWTVRS